MKMNLLILDREAEAYKKALEPNFPDVSFYAAKKQEDIGGLIEKMDILVVSRISDDLIRRASNLKWIQIKTTGVDTIVNLPSLRKEVLITSARGIHGPQMSEMAILLMLALNRNLPEVIRNQEKKVWEQWPGKLLWEKKVGILGVGVIGEEIARKCKAFGMTVFGINRTKRDIDAVDHFHGPEDLLQVIREVDYFVIVLPYTPQTEKMVGAQAIASMKPTAFLINLGRGQVIDEEALILALKNGKIAGAALDVFWTEPLPKDHPFWSMENVIVSPRVGGKTDVQVKQILPIIKTNLRRFMQGERRNLINFVEW